MTFDIFANFDDHSNGIQNSIIPMLLWTPILLIPSYKYWMITSSKFSTKNKWIIMMFNIITRTQMMNIGMAYTFFISWSMLIMWTNLMGLVPYVFSLTSHLALNLSLTLPMWLNMILMSMTFDLKTYLSHFNPMGSPTLLNPFLCVIELVSNLVRPITLSIRLAANLSTGHIMMSLLGNAYTQMSMTLMMISLLIGIFYMYFESAVCIIQTYIFTLLPILYGEDHPK